MHVVPLHDVPVALATTVSPAVALVVLRTIPTLSGVNCRDTAVLLAACPNESVTVTTTSPWVGK
jgi:hypothetical protein